MTGNDYQKLAMKTNDGGATNRVVRVIDCSSRQLDIEHAKKELGDILWYIAMICHSFGWQMDDIMQMNIDKLKARYPDGFSIEKSLYRDKNDV